MALGYSPAVSIAHVSSLGGSLNGSGLKDVVEERENFSTYCNSIAVLISGSQRKTCVTLTRLRPDEWALA